MQKIRNILIPAGVLAALAVIIAGYYLFNRMPSNPEGTVGNTAGNLNNNGLFCEYNEKIYFSNAYDNNALYVMNNDFSKVKKLSDAQVSFLNAGGKNLYYYQYGSGGNAGLGYVRSVKGLFRSNLSGKRTECLCDDAMTKAQLVGDYVYFENYQENSKMSLHKVKIDESEEIVVSPDWINPASVLNGVIYYNGTGTNHFLYALDTRTDLSTTVYEGDVWYPIADNGYVYYLNVADNYKLCRYSLSDSSVETLTEDRVDLFNLSGDMIYYSRNSITEPALMRMRIDGSNPEKVADGVYENLNIAGGTLFYNEYDKPIPVYTQNVTGPVQQFTFDTAAQAVK
ncbi:MAG: DUF5050 domain-containing protein [Lachnospiraceae bacterium]|nr:DUF5050 domain-containing protein [Lachnospiraceae bacterium]